jgi:hypothetical protein
MPDAFGSLFFVPLVLCAFGLLCLELLPSLALCMNSCLNHSGFQMFEVPFLVLYSPSLHSQSLSLL